MVHDGERMEDRALLLTDFSILLSFSRFTKKMHL